MESNYNDKFPKSRSFDPGGATELAKELSEGLEKLALQQAKKPSLIGVSLFKVNPGDGSLAYWDPGPNGAVNKAMTGAWGVDCSKYRDLAALYCAQLVRGAGVLDYLQSRSSDLNGFNVIVHLHYYRKRPKPDQGFHKDTRGQTLFFMLHYLSANRIYGAEWMRERGLRNMKKGTPRVSPAEIEGVWPVSISKDVLREKDDQPEDDRVHVFRLDAYGAVLVVDDIVHHRTPNPKSRSEWGNRTVGDYPQVSTLQAADGNQENAYYEIERGRKREREGGEVPRGRSRSRSMSREREQKEKDPETRDRWEHTFDSKPRQFFRLWVTVSRETRPVWY